MEYPHTTQSPGSEDPDAMVAELLSQLESTAPDQAAAVLGSEPHLEAEDASRAEEKEPLKSISIEVHVPHIDNPEDYEFLPGHFRVRHILQIDSRNPDRPIYTVRLTSGERATVPRDTFLSLENSARALDEFVPESDSEDELVAVGMKSRSLNLGGDGAGNGRRGPRSGASARRRPRGSTTRGSYAKYFQAPESSSSEEEEVESGNELARRYSTRRRGVVRAGRRVIKSSQDEDEDDSSARVVSRSTRNRRSGRRNLRERLEDDLSEAGSEAPKQKKYSGAREAFPELPRDDEFRLRHFASCSTCNLYEDDDVRGPLVFCQGCTSSYHQQCLGPRSSREHLVTKIDEKYFVLQCRRCLGISHQRHDVAPHLGRCAVCRKDGAMSQPLKERLSSKEEQQQRLANGGEDPITSVDMARINNVDEVLFRCASCQRAFHFEHLKTDDMQDTTELVTHFTTHWQCHECTNAPGDVEGLVAWRLEEKPAGATKLPSAELIPEVDKQYLIKWKQKSYFRTTWMPGDWVWGTTSLLMRRAFYRSPKAREPIWTTEEAISEDDLRVDIVFDVNFSSETSPEDFDKPEQVERAYVKYKGLGYEDSVWESPPNITDTARWEDFKVAFQDWLNREAISPPDRQVMNNHLASTRRLNFEKDLVLNTQPEMIRGGQLMDYQLDGVNWLYYMFLKQQNAILADDMGLGKTVQVISLFATLIQKHSCWPFLVIAPNATVPNWRREIKRWAPDMQVVTYFGSAFARQMAHDYEMFSQHGKDLRCHVVIASYESMLDQEAEKVLKKVDWAGLVVDEGQRLKNDKSQLYGRLSGINFDFKALLTGTPLQNNIRELFNLIQFLDPKNIADDMEAQYGSLTAENIRSLHDMIRPFFLRRTKTEVLPFLPPMVQIIIPVSMSVLQKKLYKSILGKNPQLIQAICKKQTSELKKTERHNLNNILVQLRKCLCHPFIYNKDIEEQTHDPQLAFQRLVEASGKLKLLKIMLPKLQERGHRVLIFSQFLENLDIVEDFLTGLELRYCRLDGRLTSRQKQQQIDAFNEPGSPFFAFLLSTRSGGVGINLATADTVIIMDPDFNPKQDMQALSRAHRIGQKNTVLVYHLTTRATVEEKIMQKGKKKLALDHVLIERMEATEDEEDLESVLKHGAQALFSDDDSPDIHYDADSINALLDRSQAEQTKEAASDTPVSSEAPQFSFARVWQNDRGSLEEVTETEEADVDAALWEGILREREREAAEEAYRKAERLGRGKRKRATVNYQTLREEEDDDAVGEASSALPSPVKARRARDNDADFHNIEHPHDSDSDDTMMDGDTAIRQTGSTKTAPFQRIQSPPAEPQPNFDLDGASDLLPSCIACGRYHLLGRCRLKTAGVEHCPLCGLAHLGGRRTCPHLHSEDQIRLMVQALNQSPENPEMVSFAKKYAKGILGHLQSSRNRLSQPIIPVQAPQPRAPEPVPEQHQNPMAHPQPQSGTTSSQASWVFDLTD
ncbi:hypothetical protein N7539_006293 [Penicillium diatomitis]|uniref:Chromatin remodeling complex subunit n=1 Tax=Penicillium diatomitis TaxID=2819901 RepID=A0A9W9X2Q2_9EURO|nr:uncharacterized protein N7539_006293 [Penicillium diatomitis]KAJ5482847.1 hypothetical protein N7539_006293 [Penicillium diatomitis]